MAETPKVVDPNNTQEVQTVETPEVATPTPPVEEVKQEVIETPVAPVVETPQTPEILQSEPVITQPVVETPVLAQETEEIKTVETQAPKTTVGKVETAQDIKTQEIANEDLTNELNEKKKTQAITEMQQLVNNGATTEQLGKFGLKNIEFKDDLNVLLKGAFKNQENTNYFGKYSTMSNENMYAEYTAGNVTPGSEQYNLLPAEKKASFDNYLKLKQEASITKKTDFTYAQNSMDMSGLEAEVPKLFSSNVRENYQKALNSPEIIKLSSEMAQKQVEMETIDIELETLQEDMEKQLAGNLGGSISAEIRQNYNMKVRDKRLKLAEYNAALGQFNSLKSNAETELKISMYEDGIAREEYNTQLSLYESRRKEAIDLQTAETQRQQEIEDRDFVIKTQEQAEARQNAFTIEMKELDQKLKTENKSGTYQTDREGNLLYVVDGVATTVKETDGTVVGVTQKKGEYSESIKQNDDGTYSVFRTYEDGRKPEMFNYGVDGESSYNTQMGVYDALSSIDAKAGKYFNGEVGKLQCGEAVNRYLQAVGITDMRVSNSYESKKDLINNNVPQVGGLAVWNPSPDGQYGENGHIGIVTGYNPEKGTVEITDWNSKLDPKTNKGDGEKNTYTIPVSQVLNSDGGFSHLEGGEEVEVSGVSSADISAYNNSTFKPQNIETEEELQKYQSFLDEKEAVYNDPNANILDILKYSRGGGDLTDTASKSLEKFDSALNQLSSIQEQISELDTGPVLGKLRSLNPYDTDAQTLKAQLTSLIPNLARGVYGEVGVLTDNDVRLYSQTIPNLTSTQETNDAVLAMTLKVVAGGYKRQLQSLAASGKDVSGFDGLYKNLTGQVEAIENRLGINENSQSSNINNLLDEFNSYNNSAAGVSNTQADYSSTLGF